MSSANEPGTPPQPPGEPPAEDGASPAPAEGQGAAHGPVTISFAEYQELKTLAAERDDYLQRLRRAVADGMNLQNRIGKLRESAQRDALRKVAERVLPLADGLSRMLEAAEKTAGSDQIAEGLRATQAEFYSILKGLGIRPIKAVGEPFDPHYHEAVLQRPAEGVEPGVVLQETRKGFLLEDELLRPAQVIVSTAPQDEKC